MHNGMTLTRIQGHGHGPESCKINQIQTISFAKIRSIQRLMTDFYTTGQYLKFEIRPSFLSRDFELGRKIDRDL